MYKLTDIYQKPIYSESSTFLGIAKEVLIDTKDGKIKYITTEDLNAFKGMPKEDLRKALKEHLFSFERVVAIDDIIILR
ncbi:MAG: PRC-barrel domain-containing protein [archaeon]